MTTLIWLACVITAWTPSSGTVDGYHVEVDGVAVADVATNQYIVCVPEKYVPLELRVQGFNATTVGEWSNPLLLKRIHDFDHDDGVVGFSDFGEFIAAFGCVHRESGVVEGCQ